MKLIYVSSNAKVFVKLRCGSLQSTGSLSNTRLCLSCLNSRTVSTRLPISAVSERGRFRVQQSITEFRTYKRYHHHHHSQSCTDTRTGYTITVGYDKTSKHRSSCHFPALRHWTDRSCSAGVVRYSTRQQGQPKSLI